MKYAYFDYAAATPMDKSVESAMAPFWREQFYNPSSNSLASRRVKHALDEARGSVARVLGVRSPEIIFTAGGTEANNMALFGIVRQYKSGHIITSALEHDSVLEPARQLEKEGHTVSIIGPNNRGIIGLHSIEEQITDNTVLVSIMMVNNEIGTLQPIKKIAARVEEINKDRKKRGVDTPLLLHTDAAQAANYFEIKVAQLGMDLMTLNGGKIYGPKQSGVLYVKTGVDIKPVLFGGGQEWGKRNGTENVAFAVGFAEALRKASKKRKSEYTRLKALQRLCMKELEKLPNVSINGSKKMRSPNNVHFTVAGYDNERLLYALEDEGFIAAVGSACSASSEKPSHVLESIGLSPAAARSSLRLSFGRDTNKEDIKGFITALKKLL